MNVWRAPILNERVRWGRAEAEDWYAMGLDEVREEPKCVRFERVDNGQVKIVVQSLYSAPTRVDGFENTFIYHIFATGDVVLEHEVIPIGRMRVDWLPRIGLSLQLPAAFDRFSWYGRGPFETYPDRKTGAKIGLYTGSIDEQYVPYVVPQNHGNKTDVRWASFTSDDGIGLAVLSMPEMNVSVTHYTNLDRALYAFQLQKADKVIFNIDHSITGVGGTPVPTRPRYRTYPQHYRYTIRFKPFSSHQTSPVQLSREVVPF